MAIRRICDDTSTLCRVNQLEQDCTFCDKFQLKLLPCTHTTNKAESKHPERRLIITIPHHERRIEATEAARSPAVLCESSCGCCCGGRSSVPHHNDDDDHDHEDDDDRDPPPRPRGGCCGGGRRCCGCHVSIHRSGSPISSSSSYQSPR